MSEAENEKLEKMIEELKGKTIELLYLTDVNADEIKPDTPLFGGEGALGLDSIDALEIVIMLEKDYGVKIDNKELGREVMTDFAALASYVLKSREGE